MNKLLYFITLFALILGCKPKFDPSADFKEIDVVYSVLDPDAPKQFVQLGRGFQNSGQNAEDISKNSDSIFQQDSMIVQLVEYLPNGSEVSRVTFKKEVFNNREEGVFANPEHYLYTLDSSVYQVKNNTDYKLFVKNSKTQKTTYSEIETLEKYRYANAFFGAVDINIVKKDTIVNDEVEIVNVNGENVIYTLDLIIPYITKDSDNNIVSKDSLVIGITQSEKGETGETTSIFISGEKIANAFWSEIEPITPGSGLTRQIDIPVLYTSCYGPNMVEYVTAEESFNALSQTKPFYTNVYDQSTGDKQAGLVTSVKTIVQVVFIADNTLKYISRQKPELGFPI